MSDLEPPTWVDMIGYIGRERMQLAEIVGDLYPMSYPGVAATSEQLDTAEQRLDGPLDNQLRELLGYINGWPNLIYWTHLMPAEDLGQGLIWDSANQALDIMYQDVDSEEAGLPPRDELFPFALSDGTTDIYVIWTGGPLTDGGHPVLWLATGEVERYKNMHDFFLDVVRRVKKLVDKRRASST